MAQKTSKQLLMDEISKRLQDMYGLSDKELASGSVIFENARVTPDEIAEKFFLLYGFEPSKKEFGGWPEFVENLAEAILEK